MNGVAFVLSCTILLVVQQATTGLNCYVCSAGTDGCGTKFSSTGGGVWTASSSNYIACSKVVYDVNNNAQSRTWSTNCTAGSSTSATGVAMTTYCCTMDLCNGVQATRANIAIATIVAAISFLLIK